MKKSFSLLGMFLIALCLEAQPYVNKVSTSSEIHQKVQKLATCGSVLYIAAHPDDENTRMLTYFAQHRNVETSYLSLTRGDGGQNLIGTEQSELLGLIRTQELLAARTVDGAKQYFTRAVDFGFSKNPDETFSIWNKETILSDVVYIIRSLKPDIIITRFTPEKAPTHGHHTGSAQLAVLAVEAAADSTRFPEQFSSVDVHQVNSLYWNTSWFHYGRHDYDKTGLLSLPIGQFSAISGKWVGEIAATSRSMHRSQGFGSAAFRGEETEYLHHLAGYKATNDIFENLDVTWDRVPGAKGFSKKVQKLIQSFDFKAPSNFIPALLTFRKEVSALPISYYRDLKIKEIDELLLECAGFYIEALAPKFEFDTEENVKIKVQVYANSNQKISWYIKENGKKTAQIASEKLSKDSINWITPEMPTNPYWLSKPAENAFFNLENPSKDLLHPGTYLYSIPVVIEMGGVSLTKEVSIINKFVKPELGEAFEYPIVLAPIQVKSVDEIIVSSEDLFMPEIEIFSSKNYDMVDVQVSNGNKIIFNKKLLNLVAGKKIFEKLLIPSAALEGNINSLQIRIMFKGKDIGFERIKIEYPHIPTQVWQRPLVIKAVKLDQEPSKKKIAYIDGAGDKVMDILKQSGYAIELLKPNEYTLSNFKKYDVIITGVRAYNTNKELVAANAELKEYIHQGGRVIVQYNTTASQLTKEIGPFPFEISRDRITDESASVEIISKHPILKGITKNDFDDWVQERGLYFPHKLSSEYVQLLEMHDPSEKANANALIYAKYGKGDFVYTGLSFFRQLPAGNKGGLRLLMALIDN